MLWYQHIFHFHLSFTPFIVQPQLPIIQVGIKFNLHYSNQVDKKDFKSPSHSGSGHWWGDHIQEGEWQIVLKVLQNWHHQKVCLNKHHHPHALVFIKMLKQVTM